MKKLFYLVPVLGMLMSSCSSEEPLPGDKNNNGEELVTNYISINIVPTSGLGSRAEDNMQDGGTYRDGSESENQVNRVRFFFFDKDDQATPVRATGENTYESYLDWYPTADNNQFGGPINDETVEKTFTATLGIFVPEDEKYSNPTSVVAVINPSEAVLSLTSDAPIMGPSLEQLQTCVADYKTNLITSNFVMSNSVYATNNTEGTNTEFIATSLTKQEGTYFKASIEAALSDPVTIYVERVVARLDLSINLDNGIEKNGEMLYPLTVVDPATGEESIQVTIDGVKKSIYIKFLGWNVTSTPNNSNLLKNINPNWTSQGLFGTETSTTTNAWTNVGLHRSFWAMNPEGTQFQFGAFNGTDDENNLNPAKGEKMPQGDKPSTIYLQENASPYAADLVPTPPTNASKVILACQLVDENGNAIPLAEWGFRKFTIDNLKTYLIGTICAGNNFYSKTTEGDQVTYTSLGVEDVEFITAAEKFNVTDGNFESHPGVKGYYSYLVLTDEVKKKQWFNGKTQDAKPVSTEEINAYFDKMVGYSMIWNQGYSYYFFDVRHLGVEGSIGYNGIVRNHIYDTHVKSIIGIGTPVLDPDEIIYPEKPEYEESIIAAEIKILQWRVVSNNYDIKW